MKNFFIFASLVIYTSFTTFTMEKEQPQKKKDFHWHSMDDIEDTTTASSISQSSYAKATADRPTQTPIKQPQQDIPQDKLKEFADQLNTAINKKCTRKDMFGYEYQLESSKLKEKDFFDIIQIIDKYSKTYNFVQTNFNETINFITKQQWYILTYDKRDYLPATMTYFTNLAEKHFNNLTNKTLDMVNDVNPSKPTALNYLPQYLRKYFMTFAYLHRIKQSYDIALTEHTDIINCVDVHEATHRAATSDHFGMLQIHDLTTGKNLCYIGIGGPASCITFNNDGSRLAAAINLPNGSSNISIWNPQSTQPSIPVCRKEVNIPNIYSLSYKNKTLVACSNDNPPKISIFSVKDGIIKEKEQAIELSQQNNNNDLRQTWGDYSAIDPHHMKQSKVTITKKNCQKFCLYQQAIKNDALNFDVERIEATPFNEYEKGILHKLLITEQSKQKI